MNEIGWFKKKQVEVREEQRMSPDAILELLLLQATLVKDNISRVQALNIPSVAGCVEIISNIVASLPIKLYREEEGNINEVKNDSRIALLNDDTGDTLDPFQFKKAMVEDFLLEGNAYAYINRDRGVAKSLHYVETNSISIIKGVDPIFKDYKLVVNAKEYDGYEFLKLLKKTKNGAEGTGIISENKDMLAVVYNSLQYENVLVKTGGNKKGFIKSQSKLTQDAIDMLKEQWNNMYKNNTENCVILNNGLEFQESSNTSVEMQLNENKKTNAAEICKLFNVPISILEGKLSENEDAFNTLIRLAIMPILEAIQIALNRDLLLEKEKGSFYFAFDTKELLKGDIEKRFRAYEIAAKNGIMQIDEIRYIEDLEPLGLKFIKLGLQDVLYNPETGEIYTPNTNKSINIDKSDYEVLKGGDDDENRN